MFVINSANLEVSKRLRDWLFEANISTNMASNITFPGNSNRGTEVGINSGNITNKINSGNIINNYGPPEGSPIKSKPSSTVPFRRDPDFVDRDILAQVDQICSKSAARAALVGLGGVGKSQLAIEYSYRIREKYPQTWIFWVHASNSTRFEEGYRKIADRIGLPHNRDESTADIFRLVSNWLSDEANGRWILILDNADDSSIFSNPRIGGDVGAAVSLSTFLPQTPNGSILVTSRSGEAALRLTGRHRDIIKVEPMDEDHALLLFEKKLSDEFDKDNAKELLRVLDYMPLAISQAAAYISQRAPRTTVAKYLDTFRESDKNQANLLNRGTEDLRRDSEASNSIITTWQISFEYIRDKRPSAARLLALMSFFDQQGIPESLLHYDRQGSSDIEFEDNADEKLKNDSDSMFEDDVFTLTSYSLVRANVKNDRFEMHRIVQFSIRKWLQLNSELEKWKKIYIGLIFKAFPDINYENWKKCRVLYPHAEAALAHRPTEQKDLLDWSEVLNKAGGFARTQGNFLKAEEMNRRALEERMKGLGDEHLDTLRSVGNLALVLQDQGKYEAAEEMDRRALDGREKVLGKEHPDTLTSISSLALVLRHQGKYKAAEEMNRRALDGYEMALGKEHPDTLASVSTMALVLQAQGKFEASEQMNRRALEGREKALGKEHPDTLTSVSHLASVVQAQRKLEAAEEMNRRALEGREKALGKEHPKTLLSVNNLASVLRHQGKYKAAEEMNRRALDGREKVLGKEHPDTLISVSNLALVLRSQGKYEEAEEMNRKALDGREKALGEEHPHTLLSVYRHAYLLHRQRKYQDATTLYERSCAGFQKVLETNHPHTLACSSDYASMIDEMEEDDRESSSRS